MSVRSMLHDSHAARSVARAVLPSRRHQAAQWSRIDAVVSTATVLFGPSRECVLPARPPGPTFPKRLGSYEAELHPIIESWTDYGSILDVGCGEGWYVVGLGRRMPGARIFGFDSSGYARQACREMAALNSVQASVSGEVDATDLASLVQGKTLIIVDAEGAEADVLDVDAAPGLRNADILVELHDFARPGVGAQIKKRFGERDIHEIHQSLRRAADYPVLSSLSVDDQVRAMDESRVAEQTWLWDAVLK